MPPRRACARIASQTALPRLAVEPGGRLVEDDEPRIAGEGERDAEPPALAAREPADLPPRQIASSSNRSHERLRPEAGARSGARTSSTSSRTRSVAGNARLLRRHADVAARPPAGAGRRRRAGPAGVGSPQAEQHGERGRLPGAVRAEQRRRPRLRRSRTRRSSSARRRAEALRHVVELAQASRRGPAPPARSEAASAAATSTL